VMDSMTDLSPTQDNCGKDKCSSRIASGGTSTTSYSFSEG
jgi:hypothetical protein